MRAMILAAGLGTRLRPLTDHRPKALVEVGGQTLLEITLRRLSSFGIHEFIVNVHHFADLVVEYLKKNDCFGMRIEVSREDVLLDTGGGLKKAAWFFLEEANHGQPFVLHNVDVLSTIDISGMARAHSETNALATLGVHDRKTSRYLLFDERDQLCGRRKAEEPPELVRTTPQPRPLAFSGVHIISPRLLAMMSEHGVFSIIDSYMRLAGRGESVRGFRVDQYYWRDLGKPENVLAAEQDIENSSIGLFKTMHLR